ncbi:MAG TPA: hypothetical protein VHQ46_05330 [Desulfobacteria bacterium]|nr:hypothetical protein [Desulfobacteria bacterium]
MIADKRGDSRKLNNFPTFGLTLKKLIGLIKSVFHILLATFVESDRQKVKLADKPVTHEDIVFKSETDCEGRPLSTVDSQSPGTKVDLNRDTSKNELQLWRNQFSLTGLRKHALRAISEVQSKISPWLGQWRDLVSRRGPPRTLFVVMNSVRLQE